MTAPPVEVRVPDGDPPRGYTLGPPEERGVILGLSAAQTLVLAAGVLAVLALVRVQQPAAAAVAAAAAAAAAFGRLGGRPVVTWAPPAAAYLAARAAGATTYRNAAPGIGHTSGGTPAGAAAAPPELRGVRLLAVTHPTDGREAGVLHDRATGWYVAVLAVTVRGYPLLDVAAQQQRLRGWAAIVEYLAREGSAIHRLQWLERTVGDDASSLRRYFTAARDPSLSPDDPTLASYTQLLAEDAATGQAHQLLLAAALDPRRRGARIRRAGGGEAGAAAVLLGEVETLGARLEASELDVERAEGILTPAALARLISVAYDPAQPGALLPAAEPHDPTGSGGAHAAWPHAAEVTWDTYRTAARAWHRTFWIAEWPRVGVAANFLLPLLLTQITRTISVTFEPIGRHAAERAVVSAQTTEEADSELRARAGFRDTARRRLQRASAAQREAELADGHVDVRFSGYVTVTAPTPDDLERACAELHAAAYATRVVLQPCDAEQQDAFAWAALPLCRGLR